MAAPIVTLAEDIKDFLNTLTLSQAYTAERLNRVREDLSDVQTLQVWVVPTEARSVVSTRSTDLMTYNVQIAVARKALPDPNTDIDDMLELVDEIQEAMMRQNFSPFQYHGQVNNPIYNPDRVDNEAVFLSIINVEYMAERE